MTPADASAVQVTLSGRELALMRRQVMALRGKAGVVKPTPPRAAADATARPAMAVSRAPQNTSAAVPQNTSAALPTGAASAARLRRQALSQSGKAALPAKTAATGPQRARPATTAGAAPAESADCGCGCKGSGGCAPAADTVTVAAASGYALSPASAMVAPANTPAPDSGSTRALARARRMALATDGKNGLRRVAQATKIAAALPGQDWQAAIAKGATGRQKAMQRRVVQSLAGSTKSGAESRPSGRMRARVEVAAPAKVGEGHTLSGRAVTGTLVDRSKKVTGNEPGSCRAVTGTEYIGAEQFDALCASRPAPAPGKVGVSHTLREHKVTGTEVGRSGKVTGDEPGACRGITGTEYLAAERFDEMCDSRPAPAAPKVLEFGTARGKSVTGASVNRSGTVTGNESGADRAITGTDYTAPGKGSRAPQKVAVTHTSHGKSVTGTAVGHADKITGDENGACRGITGTEYLAVEQFQAFCGTDAPVAPRKVSVMSSRANQTVSGTEVGRSSKVTGDEPGSCRSITGSQYYTSESFGVLCDTASPKKVALMQTLAGRSLTGTEVGRSPKVTGDEKGGCKSVTGTEYIGANQQQAVCAVSTPVAPVAKVAIDQTWRGQPVTGSYVGRSTRVTGDEPGGCSPISGTPYIGRNQYSSFCETTATHAQEARIKTSALIPATAVTGDRPGAGGSVMTGDARGACGIVSGTPYIGVDNAARSCASSGRFVSRASTWVEPTRSPAPVDFSISTPARAAQQKQSGEVTGTGYNSERITGPVNKADGLITGTPEFRHRDVASSQAAQETVISASQRLTGEGSQAGRQVTGDAWNAMSKVTGTEGASSLSRNPSARGKPRGTGTSAAHFREVVEHPVVPESRITGSSGNTGRGALVTLSGGARG